MTQEKISITGIHCSSCTKLITMNIEDLPSAQVLAIDENSGVATVNFDEQQCSLDEIKQAIRDSGDYQA
ncbi:MAG: heavy-metal-associated domain-containing protein [Candidatus Peribacteria bacterium]|nr:MAG: heavy-metal-associated domain-containing protein [Candidatus Peribacteria bacterium]